MPDVRAPADTAHHCAVLLGLTGPGGTVAAATTSLPERSGDDRNYDYRYVWVRDQCFVGQAAAACGALPLVQRSVETVAAQLREHGADLAPAYTVRGEPVPKQRHLDLPGYPGGHDIVGNRVRGQFELDAFGEALLLFAAAARRDCLDADGWRAAEVSAGAAARRWLEPDAGIWEIDDRHWTHSKLILAAGLRAIAGVAPRASAGQAAEWVALADRVVSDTAATSVHPGGHWQRAPDDPASDAALLFPGLRNAVPSDDPRTAATVAEYLRELTADGVRLSLPARRPPIARGGGLLPDVRFRDRSRAAPPGQAGRGSRLVRADPRRLRPAAAVQRGVRQPSASDAWQPAAGVRARADDRDLGDARSRVMP